MSRGQGRVFRPKVKDKKAGTVIECKTWWLDYSLGGVRHREPAGTTSKAEAQRILRERLTAREAGKVVGRPDRMTFAELRALAERQYELDGRRSLDRLRAAFNNLEPFVGAGAKVPQITTDRLDEYAKHRLAEKAARATVNYELAAMRRAFRLAIEKGLLASMPAIKLPKVHNERHGFFEDGDFAALLLELPSDVRDVVRFLRFTGWRRSEVLNLTWDQVDMDAGTIRLEASDTKGSEPRLFPFALAPEIVELVTSRWKARSGLFVCHRDGERVSIMALRCAWARACKRAGLEGRLVHDLRRSAARDLRRAGVSEGEIMKLCGWRTRSMFDRYNVIDEGDLARAVAKRYGANGKTTAQPAALKAEAKTLS